MTQLLTSNGDHILADLVEELSRKLADGDSADVEAFLAEHAPQAEKLRPLIPTLQMLVEIGSSPVASGHTRTRTAEDHEHPTGGHPVLGDFRILREVGRGGMGVVYEAEQISLRRRVALKVLPTAAMLDPRALQRFRNEAQAAAALHHSQIVPIFGVGCERGVHYYAMQFIDGLTLAEVIGSLRKSAGLAPLYQPDPPQPEASARKVGKHQPDAPARDSDRHQPEAQAKETVVQPKASSSPAPSLQPPAPVRSAPAPSPSTTETDVLAALSTEKSRTSPAWFRRIAEQFAQVADALHHAHELGVTHRDIKPANLMLDRLGHIWITDFGLARIEGEGNLTMTGDLVGTLRYMSPEQSLAKRIGIDHRTDIYSLGITLYEILTLHPALPGQGRQELLRQIAFEEPKPPRKHKRDIPKDLETIVLKMIEKNPAERYQTAADLAADLKRFVDDRHIEARRPRLFVRASRWIKRRKGYSAVAAMILFLAAAGFLGWAIDRSRRVQKATSLVNEVFEETAIRHVEAQAKRDDLVAWERAVSSAHRAKALAESGPVSTKLENEAGKMADRVEFEYKRANERILSAHRDSRIVQQLNDARIEFYATQGHEHGDYSAFHTAFQSAFRDYGIDFSQLKQVDIEQRLMASSIRERLVTGLLGWAILQPTNGHFDPSANYLLILAENSSGETPTWHKPLIDALQENGLIPLQKWAASNATSSLPPEGADCLGMALDLKRDPESALVLTQAVLAKNPGDFFLNYQVGLLLGRRINPPPGDEAIRFLTVTVAIRPGSATLRANLAAALKDRGRLDEAIAVCRDAIRMQPTCYRAHVNLGSALYDQGKLDESMAATREALRLNSKNVTAHSNLGVTLHEQGKLDEAIVAFREAIRLDATYASAHAFLGLALCDQRKLDDALVACREAIRLQPAFAEAHTNLGLVRQTQGMRNEAVAAYREAIRLKPTLAQPHYNLAGILSGMGEPENAITAYREAIRLAPRNAGYYLNLGNALQDLGNVDEASEVYRKVIDLNPASGEGHCNLARCFESKGDLRSALDEMRIGHKLGSRNPGWSYPSARWVADLELQVQLDVEFTEILKDSGTTLEPSERARWAQFALAQRHLPRTAIKWFEQAFSENPNVADDLQAGYRYNAACAALLTVTGEGNGTSSADDAEKKRLKHQALVWLRDELAAWEEYLKDRKPRRFSQAIETLTRWQTDTDLASLRDERQVHELSAEDQEICRNLWADHAELVKKVAGMPPPGK